MQITCPGCNKKFEIQDNLIPPTGRLVQCGRCEHQWFYKQSIIAKKEIKIKSPIESDQITKPVEYIEDEKKIIKTTKKDLKNLSINKENNKLQNRKKNNKEKNYFKLFIVILISIIACIILIDTFKNQISVFYPNIINVLNNLYESLKDIILFLNDLIK